MTPKQLEADSEYAKYDADGDGIVSDEELETTARLQQLEAAHEKADAQRNSAQAYTQTKNGGIK